MSEPIVLLAYLALGRDNIGGIMVSVNTHFFLFEGGGSEERSGLKL